MAEPGGPAEGSRAAIMVVEDDEIVAMAIEASLERLGYEVAAKVATGEEAVERAMDTHLDAVLMDVVLKGRMTGIEAAERIRESVDVPIVYLTAFSDQDTIRRAKRAEPQSYLVKPYEEEDLRAALEIALYAGALRRDRARAEDQLRAREKLLQDVVDGSASLITVADVHGRYELVNRAFERRFGVSRSAVRGRAPAEALPASAASVLSEIHEEALRDGRVDRRRTAFYEGGNGAGFLASAFVLSDASGRVTGVCTMAIDLDAE